MSTTRRSGSRANVQNLSHAHICRTPSAGKCPSQQNRECRSTQDFACCKSLSRKETVSRRYSRRTGLTMLVGYARISTEDQDLPLQRPALKKAACKRLYEEPVSG